MTKKIVCILDYGSGNVKSVYNLLSSFHCETIISNDNADILRATHLVLPGVGAFGASMEKLLKKIDKSFLENEVLVKRKFFLGICVGMQVLADKGYEFGEFEGLGWIQGKVEKIQSGEYPLPHIGWNNIEGVTQNKIINGLESDQNFYFVHSYVFNCVNENNIIAMTECGQKFASIINKDNIYGVQFHPEKSQQAGRLLIKNFLEL